MKRAVLSVALFFAATSAWAEERIISAGSGITELIVAMGAESQLVGVDITSKAYTGNGIPTLGYHRQLSAESIIALTPDRVVGSKEMGPETTLSLLRQAGISVDILNSGDTINDLLKRVEQVGQLTGKQAQATQLNSQIQQQVKRIESRLADKHTPKRILFLTIHAGRAPMVGGRHTTADTVIRLAGGMNPAATAIESYKPLSAEAMVEMQPDIILLSTHASQSIGGLNGLLKSLPLLAATPAGQNNALYTIDGTALIGGLNLKSLEEAERLNQVLYGQ
ncbi:ABC transporter substrate-binding protein [Photobacterium sp. WH77]|uniref:ABC transporter substrate-binding protein n=1 Tax=Photobacterium arenosum TaxID=2774143 RepID=A0ABR9BR00_9GAMM|nr:MULTISPECIES: ABC transporter substrate-binding protein [Photobacterium]MBD8513906.1 ABC transporter substrate-binding protein [Photobacterium arenosum]MBV7262452.1 ABC transporter substrate-binding protein [Photobacterium sp. WH24]MCG2836342.1 ABC transporter substrate-binding protein [Photobacterium sp. WH77]MCG2844031.1 ABC transporter substrate-binding protein [Photobacterium sp. WH80]